MLRQCNCALLRTRTQTRGLISTPTRGLHGEQHINPSAAAKGYPDPVAPMRDHEILPVPRFWNAVYKRRRPRPSFYESFCFQEDGIISIGHESPPIDGSGSVSHTGRRNISTEISKISDSNELISRLDKLEFRRIPLAQIVRGIALSVHEPQALRARLRLWATVSQQPASGFDRSLDPQSHHKIRQEPASVDGLSVTPKDKSEGTEFHVLQALEKIPTISQISTERKAQYLEALTGWVDEDLKSCQNGESKRRLSLYHVVAATSSYLGKRLICPLWKDYIHVVGAFGGAKAIIREWQELKASLSSHLVQSKGGTEELRTTEMMRASTSPAESGHLLKTSKSAVIRELARQGAWQDAWNLAYLNEPELLEQDQSAVSHATARNLSYIDVETWEELLRYPDVFFDNGTPNKGTAAKRKWIPELMNEPALRMLEKEIAKVEESFGVRWVKQGSEDKPGGTDSGYHIVDGSIQWIVADEEISVHTRKVPE